MTAKKRILAIVGSASENSANLKLVEHITDRTKAVFDVVIFNRLKTFPHFDPELSANNPPQEILNFRAKIEKADGVIICTPEYVFSIPSGLKNAIEWCIATTLFSDKPCGLITASANGEKGHEELQLIMATAMAKFTPETTLLIQGVKGKINKNGEITDSKTANALDGFVSAFSKLVML
ncbi:MAG: NAD(P)H-dependent oxidoreductase [Bacteroidales bacterium]|nr:NAD(P)H-dependent oxidoreductase [Bacteroidales bacterium]